MPRMTIGSQRLREWRYENGVTQRDLGAQVGAYALSISQYELGKKRPGIDAAVALERVTGIPVAAWTEDAAAEVA